MRIIRSKEEIMRNDKLIGIIAIVLSAAALVVGSIALIEGKRDVPEVQAEPSMIEQTSDDDIQYVLYLGTNDKDTNEPVYTPEEAMEHVDAVLTDYFYGFTIQDARGGWVNDDGSVAHEYTIVIYLSDTDLDQVHAACDALIEEFNQSSILIQQNHTTTEFYS